ncbi:MAG: hypothetical protein NVS2B16_35250 [Chloroflexota bacterium]
MGQSYSDRIPGITCGVLGAESNANHQRIAEYVKTQCEQYRGMGFTAREEWIVEQTIEALHRLLGDIQCTPDERHAIEDA